MLCLACCSQGQESGCGNFQKGLTCALEYPNIILDVSAAEAGLSDETDCQQHCVDWNNDQQHAENCSFFTWLEKSENAYHCLLLSNCQESYQPCPTNFCVTGKALLSDVNDVSDGDHV